jgi:PIN domain nuclease of toxin-antitoxin system
MHRSRLTFTVVQLNLLIDTHIAIFAFAYTNRLSSAAKALLVDTENTIFVSTLCFYEIAIKRSKSGGNQPPLSTWRMIDLSMSSGAEIISPTLRDIARLEELPRHHHDPFDRLLVSQAINGSLILVTSDKMLARYDAEVRLV